ncbi:hypothetical protein AAFF_G00433160 [Aldrovandia affinis]|uniref:Secreted protein n=1 Tax=Aldrovandia affinis TaxID=143900 RepID=A0AAD7S8P2_9TELE|nr:hypothetical protein AAFF_G00433160 [Aldrovandia affinis]
MADAVPTCFRGMHVAALPLSFLLTCAGRQPSRRAEAIMSSPSPLRARPRPHRAPKEGRSHLRLGPCCPAPLVPRPVTLCVGGGVR